MQEPCQSVRLGFVIACTRAKGSDLLLRAEAENSRALIPVKLERNRAIARWTLSAIYLTAGVFHICTPGPFLSITPNWVPFPRQVILATGLWRDCRRQRTADPTPAACRRICAGTLCDLCLSGQRQARVRGHTERTGAAELVVSCPTPRLPAGAGMVGAIRRRDHGVAVPAGVEALSPTHYVMVREGGLSSVAEANTLDPPPARRMTIMVRYTAASPSFSASSTNSSSERPVTSYWWPKSKRGLPATTASSRLVSTSSFQNLPCAVSGRVKLTTS